MKTFPLHPYRFILHVTDSTEEMQQVYTALGGKGQHDWQAGAVFCHKNKVFLGVFDGELGTLVHEASHAALDVANRVGYDPTGEQEPFAYLLEHIFIKARQKLGL
ncbi:hypothetical protein Kurepalu1_00034 [Pseudomonas phage vB_PpuP-Kurepalu-1]